MFFFSGDHIFRVNVPDEAILDPVSRIGLILGILAVFVQKKLQKNRLRVMMPFMLLLIPAMFPTLPAIQVPSSTRMFGAFPGLNIVKICAAYRKRDRAAHIECLAK
jgi:Ca2+/Na+ antiporter